MPGRAVVDYGSTAGKKRVVQLLHTCALVCLVRQSLNPNHFEPDVEHIEHTRIHIHRRCFWGEGAIATCSKLVDFTLEQIKKGIERLQMFFARTFYH